MELPLIFVNFKTYVEATGKNALRLAKICESVSKRFKVNIAVAPQFVDIYPIAKNVKIPVFSQHIDFQEAGAYTGHVSAFAIKKAGALGTLINHSEKKLILKEIEKCIQAAKRNKLISVVCSDSLAESKEILRFNPEFIAFEPPELIGTGISVSKAKPEIVSKIVGVVERINPKTKVLCGAGISSGEDVKRALELGTRGVLVSSAVVKASNPKKVLEEFAKATRSFS